MTHEEALELWRNVVRLTHHPEQEKVYDSGAVFIDPDRVYVSKNGSLEIGAGTVIAPEVYLLGNIRIGKDCIIGPGQVLSNSWLSDCVSVGARPNVHNSTLRFGSKIGRSAEIVRSQIGEATAIQHFSYTGDVAVGRLVNIGAGVVIANFDGSQKNKVEIGNCAFIGSNTTLVARPDALKIGEEAFIGAGAIIRKDVPPHAVVVGLDQILPDRECYYKNGKWEITNKTSHSGKDNL